MPVAPGELCASYQSGPAASGTSPARRRSARWRPLTPRCWRAPALRRRRRWSSGCEEPDDLRHLASSGEPDDSSQGGRVEAAVRDLAEAADGIGRRLLEPMEDLHRLGTGRLCGRERGQAEAERERLGDTQHRSGLPEWAGGAERPRGSAAAIVVEPGVTRTSDWYGGTPYEPALRLVSRGPALAERAVVVRAERAAQSQDGVEAGAVERRRRPLHTAARRPVGSPTVTTRAPAAPDR